MFLVFADCSRSSFLMLIGLFLGFSVQTFLDFSFTTVDG